MLGWLLNLGFAASGSDAEVSVTKGGGPSAAVDRKYLARLRLQQQRVDDDEIIALLVAAGIIK